MFKIIIYIVTILFFLGCRSGNNDSNSQTFNSITDDFTDDFIISKKSTPMLAILLNYNDQTVLSSETTWSNKLFGKEESQLNHYYLEASANNFEFSEANENYGVSNDGVISVTLNKNHPNINIYDESLFQRNVYPDFNNAISTLDSYIDFSNYDINADGYISRHELLFTFIVAGYEDAYESNHVTNGIWGHQSCMDSTFDELVLDSVVVMNCKNDGNFALFGEKHNMSNPHDATIGIIAHELGHSSFDLPDLYNTGHQSSGGIGYFGLMGAGTWAQKNDLEYAGNTPTHFCAWSKYMNRWVHRTVTTGRSALIETSSVDYNVIKIPINSSSYYLLENRSNNGYDRGLYSLSPFGEFQGGIAIWKINENKLTQTYIENNTVNADISNQGVDLLKAKNSSVNLGSENALYYSGNVNSFTTLVTDISVRGSVMGLNIN